MGALRCRLLGHAAMPTHYRNGDTEFALCNRCGDDLVRAAGSEEWEQVPGGQKIVWRRHASGADAAAVAERMRHAGPPRRHRPRNGTPMDTGQRRSRPRRGDVTALLELTGRYLLASAADRLRRPARPVPQPDRLLPVPGLQVTAASRSRARSRRG